MFKKCILYFDTKKIPLLPMSTNRGTRTLDYISIPKGLATKIVKSTGDLKAYSMFWKLKSLYVGGIVFNYRKKYHFISKHPNIGCSESNLRKYIGILKQMGLVWEDQGKNLCLIGKNRIKERFGVSKYNYRIPKHLICDLENVFKALALSENLQKQQYNVIQKICWEESGLDIGKAKGQEYLASTTRKMLRKSICKNLDAKLKSKQKRYVDNIRNFRFDLNEESYLPYITLSRKGIAKCIGKKSRSTGLRIIRALKKIGLVESDDPQVYEMIQDCSYEYYQQYRALHLDQVLGKHGGYNVQYNQTNSTIDLRVSNKVSLCPF